MIRLLVLLRVVLGLMMLLIVLSLKVKNSLQNSKVIVSGSVFVKMNNFSIK